ncbi:MAG: cupredoxin domain-containing protein [Anaerolineales bacterium]|nr:cupredoxin domain-containing protein [Anaerolineales bacterium]
MVRRWLVYSAALVFLVAGVTACGSGRRLPARTVSVELTEFTISPSSLSGQVGQPLTFQVTNTGVLEHTLTIQDSSGKEAASLTVKPGGSDVLTIVPFSSGEWPISCSIPGHELAGMTASLMVTP